ncbi:SIMPL domain-containing protein [Actibacterium pelagium]|uniref:26 kDa periplasmic immunogenic protein n=1 Tax=Actibacterium pelagium TaxID=2029103 RepID=A0A917EK17_9RHOB|nr:SIMPL domain-containing protein [Actibacterium pelagium]GGE46868.1 hypothetical protein GCM10011517_13260 [Actibacterium pelagium]
MTKLKIFAFLLMGLATPLAAQEGAATLTVQGRGEIAAPPDMATITVGAEARSKTAAQALDEMTKATNDVLGVLRSSGIAPQDMQTSGLSLGEVWDHQIRNEDGQPRLVGYSASNRISIRVKEIDQLGQVLDAVVRVGATTFHGLSFGLQEPEPLFDLARVDAVADARRKAELYAQAAGVQLGPIVSITEPGFSAPVVAQMRMADAVMEAVPIAAGEVSTAAQVTIVYSLVQPNE